MARTHYEVLGISQDATLAEIDAALQRALAAREREDSPPDASDEARLYEAYEALSERNRRAAYDATLQKVVARKSRGGNVAIISVAAVVALGIGLYFVLRSKEPPAPAPSAVQGLLAAATPAVGRMTAVDMGGQTVASGVAFAVEPGVLLTSCTGLTPNVQVRVEFTPRVVPARLVSTDTAKGLCKLEAAGAGSSPLQAARTAAKRGDPVYAVQLNEKGEVALRDAMVMAIRPGEKGSAVEITVPTPARHGGAPLLDSQGRVAAVVIATPDGAGTYVAYP